MNGFSKKNPSERVISQERKLQKFGEIFFFDVHLKRNGLVYIKTNLKNIFS